MSYIRCDLPRELFTHCRPRGKASSITKGETYLHCFLRSGQFNNRLSTLDAFCARWTSVTAPLTASVRDVLRRFLVAMTHKWQSLSAETGAWAWGRRTVCRVGPAHLLLLTTAFGVFAGVLALTLVMLPCQ